MCVVYISITLVFVDVGHVRLYDKHYIACVHTICCLIGVYTVLSFNHVSVLI